MFMYELLTCKKPLEDVTNPTLFICQNGRPSISRRVSTVYMLHLNVYLFLLQFYFFCEKEPKKICKCPLCQESFNL